MFLSRIKILTLYIIAIIFFANCQTHLNPLQTASANAKNVVKIDCMYKQESNHVKALIKIRADEPAEEVTIDESDLGNIVNIEGIYGNDKGKNIKIVNKCDAVPEFSSNIRHSTDEKGYNISVIMPKKTKVLSSNVDSTNQKIRIFAIMPISPDHIALDPDKKDLEGDVETAGSDSESGAGYSGNKENDESEEDEVYVSTMSSQFAEIISGLASYYNHYSGVILGDSKSGKGKYDDYEDEVVRRKRHDSDDDSYSDSELDGGTIKMSPRYIDVYMTDLSKSNVSQSKKKKGVRQDLSSDGSGYSFGVVPAPARKKYKESNQVAVLYGANVSGSGGGASQGSQSSQGSESEDSEVDSGGAKSVGSGFLRVPVSTKKPEQKYIDVSISLVKAVEDDPSSSASAGLDGTEYESEEEYERARQDKKISSSKEAKASRSIITSPFKYITNSNDTVADTIVNAVEYANENDIYVPNAAQNVASAVKTANKIKKINNGVADSINDIGESFLVPAMASIHSNATEINDGVESLGGSAGRSRVAHSRKTKSVSNGKKVVIDAGHGGLDHGSTYDIELSPLSNGKKTKIYEKNIAMLYALSIGDKMESKGWKVEYTRSGDYFVEKDRRVAFVKSSQPDLLISVHADASQIKSSYGVSVHIPSKNSQLNENEDADNAGIIESVVDSATDKRIRRQSMLTAKKVSKSIQSNGLHLNLNRPDSSELYTIESSRGVPSFLVEVGNMNDASDVKKMQNPDYMDRVTSAITNAI